MAQQLQRAIQDVHYWDAWAVKDLRRNNDFREARGNAKRAWDNADSLAEQLRAEIRGEAAPPLSKLLLPAHPESWPGM